MTEIIPAVLSKTYEDLKNKVAIVKGIVPMVQVDICDGIFAPNMTWPFRSVDKERGVAGAELDRHFLDILNEREGMPFWEDMDFELDLMVSDAVSNFDIYTKLGPKRIYFHIEAMDNLQDFRHFLEGIDMYIRDSIEIGVAIRPGTPLEHLFSIANDIDCVQFMGNDKVSYNGVSLDNKVYERIKILKGKYPDLPISVDIGVNAETAPLLVKAGATRLVAGSAIFNSDDIIGTVERFRSL